MRKEMIERAAKAMALHAGWEKWDSAKTFCDTPGGNDPEDERQYWIDLATIAINQTAANKAAEEGGPLAVKAIAAAEEWANAEWAHAKNLGAGGPGAAERCNKAEIACRTAINELAAGRASCQVANNAEVDLSSLNVQTGADIELVYCNRDEEFVRLDDVKALLATPPATTGASGGWQKLNDVQWMNIVNHDRAYESYSKEDAVHEAVKRTEAKLKELNAGSAPASTVLTDERIAELFEESGKSAGMIGRYIRFARAIEREVAAQAGQVAVPEDVARDAARYRWLGERFIGFDFYWMGTPPYEAEEDKGKCVIVFECGQDFEAGRHFQHEIDKKIGFAAAPSPAKESK